MFGGAATAIAEPGKAGTHDPGADDSNPNNDHGRCTAFFNGQKKGHTSPTDEVLQAIYDACQDENIQGRPDKGRFPECFDGDSAEDECTEPAPQQDGPDLSGVPTP